MKEQLLALNKPSKYIHFAISIIIMAIFFCLPAPVPITEMGMKVTGVFIAMVYAWITVDLVVSSMFYMAMLGAFTGYGSVATVLQNGLAASSILLVFLVMILTSIFSESGAAKLVAGKIINAKIGRGRPYVLLLLICIAGLVVGALTTASVATLMMWTIIYAISEYIGYKPGEKWPFIACIMAWFCIDKGYIILPFRPSATQGLSIYESLSGISVSYASYGIFSVITTAICIGILLLIVRFIMKPDVSKIIALSNKTLDVPKSTKYQRFVIILMLVMCVALTIPNVLPGGWGFTKFFKSLSNLGIVLVLIVVAMMAPFDDKVPFKSMMKGVNWNVIFLSGAGVVGASALASDDCGVVTWLSDTLGPVVAGMSPFAFIAVLYIIMAVLTQFVSSRAVMAAFAAIGYSLASGSGMLEAHPFIGPMFATMLVFAASTAVLTPAGCGAAGLVHGNLTWIPAGPRTKFLLVMVAVSAAVCIFVGYPLGTILF